MSINPAGSARSTAPEAFVDMGTFPVAFIAGRRWGGLSEFARNALLGQGGGDVPGEAVPIIHNANGR